MNWKSLSNNYNHPKRGKSQVFNWPKVLTSKVVHRNVEKRIFAGNNSADCAVIANRWQFLFPLYSRIVSIDPEGLIDKSHIPTRPRRVTGKCRYLGSARAAVPSTACHSVMLSTSRMHYNQFATMGRALVR